MASREWKTIKARYSWWGYSFCRHQCFVQEGDASHRSKKASPEKLNWGLSDSKKRYGITLTQPRSGGAGMRPWGNKGATGPVILNLDQKSRREAGPDPETQGAAWIYVLNPVGIQGERLLGDHVITQGKDNEVWVQLVTVDGEGT